MDSFGCLSVSPQHSNSDSSCISDVSYPCVDNTGLVNMGMKSENPYHIEPEETNEYNSGHTMEELPRYDQEVDEQNYTKKPQPQENTKVKSDYTTMNDIFLRNATKVSISSLNTEKMLQVKHKTDIVITSQSSVSGITDIPTPCVIDVLSSNLTSDVSGIAINTTDEVNICNSSEIPFRNVDGMDISRDGSTDSQDDEVIDKDHATDFSMLPPTEDEKSSSSGTNPTAARLESNEVVTLQKMRINNYVSMNDMERITNEANDNKWKLTAAPLGSGTTAKYEIRSKKSSYVGISEIKARKHGLPLKSQDTAKPTDSKVDGENHSNFYEDIIPLFANLKRRITANYKKRTKVCQSLGLKVACVVSSILCCMFLGMTISQYIIPKPGLMHKGTTSSDLEELSTDFTTMITVSTTKKDWSLAAHTPYNWRKVIVNNGTKPSNCLIRAGPNNIRGMAKCLEKGVNIQAIHGGGTMLMHACRNKMSTKTVKFLLDNGANVNATNQKNETVLHFCCYSGSDSVKNMETLLQAGADVDATDINGETALHISASRGREKMAQKLLEYDADLSVRNNIGNNKQTARILLPDINQSGMGKTVMRSIFLFNHSRLVYIRYNALQKLLQTIQGTSYKLEGFADVLELLIDAKINTNVLEENGNSVLMLVSLHSYNNILMYLVEDESCNINAVNKYGHTALIQATKLGNYLGVMLLLGARADIHITDINKQSALHIACQQGNIHIIKSLLRRNATIDAKGKRGRTPLMYAILEGNADVVEVLLTYKLNLEIHDNSKGYTALHHASKRGDTDIMKLLLERNTDKNARASLHGETPLMVAVSYGQIKAVQVLLSYKADLKIKDSRGLLAHNKVRSRKMRKFLLEHRENL